MLVDPLFIVIDRCSG